MATPPSLFVNGTLLLVSFFLTLIMLESGSRYFWYTGYTPQQQRLRVRLILALFGIIVIGLVGSVYNIFFA